MVSSLILASLAGCGSSGTTTSSDAPASSVADSAASEPAAPSSADKVSIRYALWDMNQMPAYEQIVAQFMEENPNIDVQLELIPWADYWTKLTTQASSGSCPDLMTMFILQFKTLQSKGVLADIKPYIEADQVDMSKYNTTAVDSFTVDGKIYGLPKDFDSIATFYNKDLLKAAGYDEYPTGLSWNVEDGGTYVEFLKKLTLDKNGKHPGEEGFDTKNIVQYGLMPIDRTDYSLDGLISTAIKQTGGTLYNPDTSALTLDDPKSAEAMDFIWKLTNEWFVAPSVTVIQSTGAEAIFYSQVAATWINGPWMTKAIDENVDFEFAVAPNLVGPNGKSVSRVNSLIDCVFEQSPNKDAAWKLLQYIASEPGQTILGQTGTVIPAHSDCSSYYVDYYAALGFDVQVFIDAYNGEVVFPPSMIEFPRADDIVMRNMTLALDGTGAVSMQSVIETIQNETTDFLVEANK